MPRFLPSRAKAIADKVISDELTGAVYDEEDSKNWGVNISDKIRELVTGTVLISGASASSYPNM